MPEENKDGSVENTGSPDLNKLDPANAGESNDVNQVDAAMRKQNEELEKKLGQQGQELGDYRDFVKSITPLLDKLDEQPDLIQAILDGKVNQDLVKSALDGKISVQDAKDVSTAHDKVKKNMGKEYEEATPDEVEAKIKAELEKQSEVFNQRLAENEELRDFKHSVQEFMNNTPDFPEYADEVTKFLDEHPNIDDISIAYDVVRGRTFGKKVKEHEEKTAAEKAKELALNASGGSSNGGTLKEGTELVDQLISKQANLNNF